MNIRRIAAITAAGAIVAGGAGVAIGATSGSEAEKEVLADAAKRLDTTPEKLRSALAAAQDAQLDRAVKAGELTQAQADEIKARRRADGRVLGGPGRRGPGHHKGGFRGPGRGIPILREVARALGLTEAELHERLHDGRSIAEIAKSLNKSLDSVKDAVRKAVKAELDKLVKARTITQAQADARLAHLDEHLEDFDQAGGFRRGGRHGGPPPGPPPTP
jgi:gas vesicle protein